MLGRKLKRSRTYLRPLLLVLIGFGSWLPSVDSIAQEQGQTTAPVDIRQAAREAISWHPSIFEAAARLNQQEQQVDVAKSGYYPQITGGIGTGYNSGSNNRWRPRANLNVEQRILDFGKLSNEVASEKAGVRANRAGILLAVDAIARDTSYSVLEVLRGEALLDVAHEQFESVSAISELVEARYQRGAATRSDALQAQSRVDAAQSSILQIEAELRRWQSNLAYLLGREQTPDVIAGELDVSGDACKSRDINWPRVPSMMEAEARREQAVADLKRARAERYPTISLGAGAATEIHDPFVDRRSDYNVGLNVSTSVFDGGATAATARSANYALEAANAALDNARLETTRLLAESREQVTALDQRLISLDAREKKMDETKALYRLQYLEMGTRTLVDLLNAEQELGQARFDAVNSRYDLRRLGIDCLYTMGELRHALDLEDMTIEGVAL